MSNASIDLNGIRCLRVRRVDCWKGIPFYECDLDPTDQGQPTAANVPTGQATITIQPEGLPAIVLQGTVDPDASGRFVASVPVRVVGGGYGWQKSGNKQAWHSDAGVSSLTVENATAAMVGEDTFGPVVDPSPQLLGIDWSLTTEQPASSIFGARDWYVGPDGVTYVQSRPTAQPDPSVLVLEWEPMHQHGIAAGDSLVMPGTVLKDERWDGPITVRDVVQTWEPTGTRVEFWCGASPAPRLISSLINMVRALSGIAHLKRYRYRIVSQGGDGRLTLQAVDNPDGTKSGAPDVTPLSVSPGMSGLSALYKTSSFCTVAFLQGDPAQGFVESFDSSSIPAEVTLDASGTVHVGPSSQAVELAGGGRAASGVGDTCYVVGAVSGSVIVAGVPSPCTGVLTGLGTIQTGFGKVSGS